MLVCEWASALISIRAGIWKETWADNQLLLAGVYENGNKE
jgi:hypothetical protein